MQEVWIIDAARSPRGLGRPDKGSLAHIHPQRLLSQVLAAIAERNQLRTDAIEHVIVGCGNPAGTQRGDIARMAALDAGWLHSSGTTVDHFCGSSLMATLFGANCISTGMHDLVITGGVEMMSLPEKPNLATDQHNLQLREKHPITSVGISADVIATEEGFSRSDVDAFAARSQQRALQAIDSGYFEKSIVPIKNDDGSLALARDEYPRPGTTAEALAELKPVFADFLDYPMDDNHTFGEVARMTWPDLEIDHVHHAGNSSGIVDGAAAVVLASPEYARANGLKPRARIVSSASVAGSPEYNLNEPVPSARKALASAGLTVDDIDLFEVNEAFAVVPLRFMKLMGVDHDKLNVNGGAIALGHPIGATGAILLGTLLDELERRELKRGLVTLCAAGGLAPSMIIERM
ncbi:acetyl-CoA C-acyltransferase [Pseudohalioglobus sediminis]|uniref:Acetyl-CoA C-acyltransferase n=1 Tax=Pseudohalioglobus sediminis TaxID=2606449 RepID=A0A5B0X1T0_9GAMM|nr:acetyl-CoA C-acyltransferase [Pseudohalioglobus sediminis]KAA1192628.1 acetyl-CoA C-acyltransferase [Pseudohalioglobus sediminis]